MTWEVMVSATGLPDDGPMTTYGLAHLHDPALNGEVVDYIDRIQATMDPFGGRFLAHGPDVGVVEGEWPGTVVLLEFPDAEAATAWYGSEAYQEILPLRTRHIRSDVIVFDGVPEGYDAKRTAARYRAALAG
jgi:uncharacterized protein (DUF1330 family)